MKVLHVLKKLLIVCSLSCSLLVADKLSTILSDTKHHILEYQKKRIEAESDKLERSWIEPIRLRYGKDYSTQFRGKTIQTGAFSVTVDQPIFRSGGIYQAIKYAHAYRKEKTTEWKIQKHQWIAEAVRILFELKKNRLQQQKLHHVIANDTIDIRQKKDRYRAGLIDSSFLDQAILKKSQDEIKLLELRQAASELRQRFSILSDKKPEDLPLPHFKLIEFSHYLQRNLDLQKAEEHAKSARYQSNMTVAKYLPSVSVRATYTDGDLNPLWSGVSPSLKERYYNYGFQVTMPIDINTFADMESAKVKKLQAQAEVLDTKKSVSEAYRWIVDTLNLLDRKIALAKKDETVYKNLYTTTKNLVKAGEKTSLDAEVMMHSLQVRRIDRQIYEIEKQLFLLKLYEKVDTDAF